MGRAARVQCCHPDPPGGFQGLGGSLECGPSLQTPSLWFKRPSELGPDLSSLNWPFVALHGPPLCVRALNGCLRFVWANLDGLLDNTYNRRTKPFVRESTLWERVCNCVRFSIFLHMHACVFMHVHVATSYTLGKLNVGHKALRDFSEMFGPPPTT
ncbi:hypothetical protein XENOCAPTIV_014696 [Xenoophorus captivus]|uniref:Uncharacterized protein n=1 Tax=Xenoophorus captivus TaxID=1517983 RepID=A0ABV0RVW0_9TELE